MDPTARTGGSTVRDQMSPIGWRLCRSATLAIVFLPAWFAAGSGSEVSRGDRPNVVMIIADDMAFDDFGFMGNAEIRTPHLDALAKRSTVFTHGYVPSSVCRPSLATLLTGLYPHQHGVHFNHPPPGFSKLTRTLDRDGYEEARKRAEYLIGERQTLPRTLVAAGYRCLQTGKHWEGDWSTAGFTEGMTTGRPVADATYGNKQLANGQWVAHGNGDAGLAIGRETMKPIKDFLADVGKTPFLIWYAPFLPHLPHDSPRRYRDLYDPDLPEHLRAHYAACSQFDQTVGRLIEMVEGHAGQRETLYVFVSDNGFRPDPEQPMKDGQGFNYTRRSKRSPFEDGLRTPILLSMPGRTKAIRDDMLCSSVDLMPTILEACGLSTAQRLPGRSLWPLATGRVSGLPRRPVMGAIYPGDASVLGDPDRDVAYRWIRDGAYKLIVPKRGEDPVWGRYVDSTELYNLQDDPLERQNLADEADSQVIRKRLEAGIDRWWRPLSPNGQPDDGK